VLEAEVDYAVGAWAEAIDGDDGPLDAVASANAAQELLYPGDAAMNRRLVVRGPGVRSVKIVELDAQAKPPSMLVQLRVSGRRYVEDRTTTVVLSGDKSVQTSFTQHWRMALTGDDAHPWRIIAVESGSTRELAVEAEPAGPRDGAAR
jgi:hypothetical protein